MAIAFTSADLVAQADAGTGHRYLTPDTVRTIYEAGFSRILAAIRDTSPTSEDWPVAALGRFKGRYVRWATLRGQAYMPLEGGFQGGGWLCVIPPGSPVLDLMHSTLQTDPSPTLHVVQIKPEAVTVEWAGIFLTHELSHLADRVTGITQPNPARRDFLMSEFRAYELELLAAELVSDGTLLGRLDALLDSWKPRTLLDAANGAAALASSNGPYLDSAVASTPPQSPAEGALRTGFFGAALLLRHAQRTGLTAEATLPGLERMFMQIAPTALPK